ncbi:hypothetical protein Q31b_00900 [Novipirellula aureliae]|uniref:Uncharacterized protein n=1 Tax=Novipirellula aureliae TaxID=2527966 RepID=A0A5C6ECL8_9BACT|nr:hypothetical protein [Novipirellula aureliae]TWU44919.1 hypothetical protein Q31b_00900 [Novipirellula aureliae]
MTKHRRIARGRINDRDYKIIEHISRYRLTTREVLHRLFFDDSDINAVSKVTSRLEADQFVKSHSLDGSAKYINLGVNACKLLGESSKHAKPLGTQALVHWYGKLLFCCGQLPTRELFRIRDLKKKQPDLLIPGFSHNAYYLHTDVNPQRKSLGFIRVDHGRDVSSLLTQCQAEVHGRTEHPFWHSIVERRQFVVTVVTAFEQKAELISAKAKERNLPFPIRVEAFEKLASLLGGPAN